MSISIIHFKEFAKKILFVLFIILSFRIVVAQISILENFLNFERCSFFYSSILTNNIISKRIESVDIIGFFIPTFSSKGNETGIKIANETVVNDNVTLEEIIMPQKSETKEVSDRNIEESYNYVYNSVKIKNQSDYDLTDDMFNLDNIKFNNKKIIIYHTHTCESYTPSDKYNYTMTGNYRTTDNSFNMVRVGNELERFLSKDGFEVIHNTFCHDYPSYNGSYDRSLETVSKIINENLDTEIVIDMHRDAVGDGSWYGPTVIIDGKSVAQMMFVVGTDGGGLQHPNWLSNLQEVMKIQSIGNTMYPGLFRPIILRNSRYNQHVSNGAFIIEVGATGNTLDECLLSMQCLANIFNELYK